MEGNLDRLYLLSQKFLTAKNQTYRRYFIRNTKLSERMSILIGQRGVGKTTILIQCLLDYAQQDHLNQKILYVPSDHLSLGGLSLYQITEEFVKYGGEFIAFDEIHKVPSWSKELKSIYDSFPKLKVLASGSSALEIYKGSHDLSRRALVYRILGLSFREYLELSFPLQFQAYSLSDLLAKHQKYADQIMKELDGVKADKILLNFKNYLNFGYYPYYFELKNKEKLEITLEQNVHTTIEADLTILHPNLLGQSIKKIRHLLTFIAQHVPYTPNWSNLKKVLDVGDERTLKTYLSLLEDADLVLTLYRSSQKLESHENPAKIYLQNPNLCFVIAKGYENHGTVRETFLFSMLYRFHDVTMPLNGDFLIDQEILLEVGGANKSTKQIREHQKAYVVQDNLEIGISNKIPLWLFGFLY